MTSSSNNINKVFSQETQEKYWRNYPEPLRKRLHELGLTLRTLSELADVPVMTLSQMFNGKREPGIFTAKRVAYALHMSLERLTEILEDVNQNGALQNHTQTSRVNSLTTNGVSNSARNQKLYSFVTVKAG